MMGRDPAQTQALAEARATANAAALARCDPSSGYRLGTGDVVSIRVYGAEEEQRWERVRLDDSGLVTLPFGQFKVRGQTTQQIEGAITESIKGRLLKNPRVWVNVDEYRSFFVEGQVGRPGAYPYQAGLDVRKAVTIGGGFRERASYEKIFVVPEGDRSANRQRAGLNTPVCPGDTVTVEESFF
jgi:polysaccharide export outer membrane protein